MRNLDATGFGLDGPRLVADFLRQIEPGAIRQDDVVLTPDEFGDYALHLEPVVPDGVLLPKEEWLVETCLQEHVQERKVLLYVRQTGTGDIQPRLREILEEVGLRAVILPDSVSPKRREASIRQQADEIDVLTTNPARWKPVSIW